MKQLTAEIAIIGGSGVYDLPDLTQQVWARVGSSFGLTSDEFLFGNLHGVPVVFVPRHGRGHVLPPGAINYRANIEALKSCKVRDIISISAVGSLVDNLSPGTFVLVDQYIDRTTSRENSFFGPGCSAHVSMAQPTCIQLSMLLKIAADELGIRCQMGGTYLAMEGPQFSSFAESNLYRSWNCDVIGMTNLPEAKLAREAELCYSSVCMVTDFDCWHPEHDNVSVADVVQVMSKNSRQAQELVVRVLPKITSASDRETWHGRFALENAIITPLAQRNRELTTKLTSVAGRVL